jgi:hypothetical protein
MAAVNGMGGIAVEGPRRTSVIRPRTDAAAWQGVAEPEPEADGAAQTEGTTSTLALDGLLALQESVGQADTGELEADRPAREHGRRLLAALGGLQRQVLIDGDAGPALDQLLSLAEATPEAADPTLAAALGAIRLRVRLELARRGF